MFTHHSQAFDMDHLYMINTTFCVKSTTTSGLRSAGLAAQA